MYKMRGLFTLMAVTSGTGTAAGTMADIIPLAAALIGASCAIITTIAAIYFHRKNYLLNYEKVHGTPRKVSKDNK